MSLLNTPHNFYCMQCAVAIENAQFWGIKAQMDTKYLSQENICGASSKQQNLQVYVMCERL